MAGTNYKISELPAVTTLDGNNVLPVVDLVASSTKKATVQQVLNFITSSTINNLSVIAGSFINLNTTTLTSSNASITILSASVISASSYVNLPNLAAGGTNGSIQYNVGGFSAGDSNKLVLDYANNFFGVGVNPPLARFHAKASSGETARLETTVLRGNGTNYLSFHDPVGIKGYVGYGGTTNDHLNISNAVGNADITLLTSGSDGNLERMRISSAGNVGIGTTAPQLALDVVGSMRLSTGVIYRPDISGVALNLGNGTNTHFGNHIFKDGVGTNERMRITDGGNVGIGTSDPNFRLAVTGNLGVSGNVTIANGNVVFGTSGKGIDFSNKTPDGTGYNISNEILDDYERGNWTPGLSGSTTAGAFTFSFTTAEYIKIGSLVSCYCIMDLSNIDTAPVGQIRITGLPFVVMSVLPIGFSIPFWSNVSTGISGVWGEWVNGSTYINLYKVPFLANTSSGFAFNASDLTNSTRFKFTFFYTTLQ